MSTSFLHMQLHLENTAQTVVLAHKVNRSVLNSIIYSTFLVVTLLFSNQNLNSDVVSGVKKVGGREDSGGESKHIHILTHPYLRHTPHPHHSHTPPSHTHPRHTHPPTCAHGWGELRWTAVDFEERC